VPCIHEGLDAHPVAGKKEPAAVPVPEREGEHAPKLGKAVHAVSLVGPQQYLRIGSGVKAGPAPLELGPQLAVVVDLAIEDERQRVVVAEHRLIAGGEVDDGETAMPETDRPLDEETVSVRSSMGQDVRHRTHQSRIGGSAICPEQAGDSAQGQSLARRGGRATRAGCGVRRGGATGGAAGTVATAVSARCKTSTLRIAVIATRWKNRSKYDMLRKAPLMRKPIKPTSIICAAKK